MARHNREGRGTDQRGYDYKVDYQPDWLRVVKVTRKLESGRKSTKTLFRNPGRKEQPPGARVRTRLDSTEQDLDFEVTIDDPKGVIQRVIVETIDPSSRAVGRKKKEDTIVFTLEDILPPPNGDG